VSSFAAHPPDIPEPIIIASKSIITAVEMVVYYNERVSELFH
jgi:hypothetical protein